jgi:hypothetical protein
VIGKLTAGIEKAIRIQLVRRGDGKVYDGSPGQERGRSVAGLPGRARMELRAAGGLSSIKFC